MYQAKVAATMLNSAATTASSASRKLRSRCCVFVFKHPAPFCVCWYLHPPCRGRRAVDPSGALRRWLAGSKFCACPIDLHPPRMLRERCTIQPIALLSGVDWRFATGRLLVDPYGGRGGNSRPISPTNNGHTNPLFTIVLL